MPTQLSRTLAIGALAALALLPSVSAGATVTGGRIVFNSDRSGGGDLWLADADGTDPVRLTSGGSDQGGAWSPDGARIAYASVGDGGSAVWVVNADGSDPHVVADTAGFDIEPAWSPDGSTIAFSADGAVPDVDYEIWVASSDGNSVARFTDDADSESAATWSPAGDAIAFFRGPHLVVAPFPGDGSGTTVATLRGSGVSPDWSPDGNAFVFGMFPRRADRADVYTLRADGTGLRRLTRGDGGDAMWTPDGGSILWSRAAADGTGIWRMDSNGRHKVQLTYPGAGFHDVNPDQQPVTS